MSSTPGRGLDVLAPLATIGGLASIGIVSKSVGDPNTVRGVAITGLVTPSGLGWHIVAPIAIRSPIDG